MQVIWLNNMTMSPALSLISMPHLLPKWSPPSSQTHGWILTSWLLKDMYLERVWRRNPAALNRTRRTRQTHLCNRLMSKAKSANFSEIIADHSGAHRSLWQAFSKILHCCPKVHLPDRCAIEALANTFSSVIINKISLIRYSFSGACSDVLNPPVFWDGFEEPNLCYW